MGVSTLGSNYAPTFGFSKVQSNPFVRAQSQADGVKPKGDSFEKSTEEPSMPGLNDNVDLLIDSKACVSDIYRTIKEVGCVSLQSIAYGLTTKASGIVSGIFSKLDGLNAQIEQLSKQGGTKEEIETKIALLTAQKDAAIKEGEAKADALVKVGNVLLDLVPIFLKLQEMGISTGDLTAQIKDCVNSISTAPSDLSKAKNPKEVEKMSANKIKNMFGDNSVDKMKSKDEGFDKKINENKEKLNKKDLDPKEKEKLELEIQAFEIQKKLFKGFFKQLDGIKAE